MTATPIPDLDSARDLLRSRMAALSLTPNRVETLAGVPEGTARRLLAGDGCAAKSLLALLAAVGVRVIAAPIRGYDPPAKLPPGPKPPEK